MQLVLQRKVENGKRQTLVYRLTRMAFLDTDQTDFSLKLARIP